MMHVHTLQDWFNLEMERETFDYCLLIKNGQLGARLPVPSKNYKLSWLRSRHLPV